ncbi:G patch domain-containing protein 4 [Pelodytes ibericus]
MGTPAPNKGQGMRFAEEQMQRHGWTKGKGLGKRENGISEAIKVKVKCDTAGVGHNAAEQFTFHWWDHVFNQTASSISVEADQDGVQVKRVKEETSSVTNKKPRKAAANRNMLYGRFVKSATLLSGGEQPVAKSSSSESSDSEDEDEKLDLSSAAKMTDDDLMKVCGGRTAHKGARHGLTMSAKLSRLEEQERAFLEKYGKKEQKNKAKPEAPEDDVGSAKKHKKNKKHAREIESEETEERLPELSRKKKKTKDLDKEEPNEEELEGCTEQGLTRATKKKKKNKKRCLGSDSPDGQKEQDGESTDSYVKSKKKKKRTD